MSVRSRAGEQERKQKESRQEVVQMQASKEGKVLRNLVTEDGAAPEKLAQKYLEKGGKKEKHSPFTRRWCLYDLATVLFHFLAILFFTLVPISLALFDEIVIGARAQSTATRSRFKT